MKTAFLTGGGGFVGGNLARLLVERGWRVRALVRGDAANLDGTGAEIVRGDLSDPALPGKMRGADALFHVAAHYSLLRRDAEALYRSNVVGTYDVLRAARAAGVPRTVYTSSVAAIGVNAHAPVTDETYQSPRRKLVGAYKKSKYDAEQVARAAARDGQDVVIVNPSTPIGPYDRKPTPTQAEMIVRFCTGGMPAFVDTGLNFIDVRDCALGHLLAYERGRSGERYILGCENLTLRALFERLAAITGRPAPRVSVPLWLPLAAAAIDEGVLGRFGRTPSVAIDAVRMARQSMFYTASKAMDRLGLPQRSIDEALEDAVRWFTDNGYLSPQSAAARRTRP
jgi:dihydroflavonol-4-reductase